MNDDSAVNPEQVLDFWFSEEHRPLWFRSTAEFDALIRERFSETWSRALNHGLDHWRTGARGALALVIVLDQFPLNMFRGMPESFSGEGAARDVAAEALDRGFDEALGNEERGFLYLPFMHSENPADQDRSVALYEAAGMKDSLRWARHHREIVRRFGRFPHRNAILGRESTREELDWLASPEAFKG